MKAAQSLNTGGIAAFTAHFFAPMGDYKPRPDLIGKPPDTWDTKEDEYVPFIPLPWAVRVAHEERLDITIIGGVGTTDVDCRIYEAELGKYVTLRWLIEHNRAPVVLSKTPMGWAKVRASVPYYEGTGPMYRVTTKAGRIIDAALGHRLLTSRGYVHILDLRPGDQLVVPDSLPAAVLDESEDDFRYQETEAGCQDGCSSHRHLCDVQPPLASAGDQSSSPSPGDVPSSSHSTLPADARAQALRCNVASVDVLRLPRRGSTRLFVLQAEPGVPRRWREASDVLARPAQADQVLRISSCKSNPGWRDVLESRHIDLAPMASSCDENGRIVWSYHVASPDLTGLYDSFRDAWLQQSASPAHQPELAASPESAKTNHDVSSSLPPSNSDWWNCTALDEVESVMYIGERDFYDLHVPVYNNYVAEGMVSHNCGKTINVGAVLFYLAAMIANFKAMVVAPTAWQSKLMYEAIRMELVDWDNRDTRPTHATRLIVKMTERPYPKVVLFNGATIEFMSADEQGSKIMGWWGDIAVVDEADKLMQIARTDLDELLSHLGTRLRGQVGGRVRIGKLIVMANAGYEPTLWERFDMAKRIPNEYVSILLTTYDNPYLSRKQIKGFERRIKDPARRRQLMLSERPLPEGDEFPPELLALAQCKELDQTMDDAIVRRLPGYHIEEMQSAGVVYWVTPPRAGDQYILLGDPGQSTPPSRNSAVIICLKVTDFPKQPAELAAFWWGPVRPEESGSYWPFVYQMERWYHEYRPVHAGYDGTGIQKGFDELVFRMRGMIMEGINMAGQKMRMVTALKLIMGKGLLHLPDKIAGIWLQLAGWHMPDKKLRQDIASCLFMCADVLTRLFPFEEGIEEDVHQDDRYGSRRPKRRPNATRRLRRGSWKRPNRN